MYVAVVWSLRLSSQILGKLNGARYGVYTLQPDGGTTISLSRFGPMMSSMGIWKCRAQRSMICLALICLASLSRTEK